MPLEMARLKNEDSSDLSTTMSTASDMGDEDFSFQMDERNDAYMNNHIPSLELEKENALIM